MRLKILIFVCLLLYNGAASDQNIQILNVEQVNQTSLRLNWNNTYQDANENSFNNYQVEIKRVYYYDRYYRTARETVKVNSNDVILNLPSNYKYSFRVRTCFEKSRCSEFSEPSKETDMFINVNIVAKQSDLGELTVKWFQNNTNGIVYDVNRCRIEVRNRTHKIRDLECDKSHKMATYQIKQYMDEGDVSIEISVNDFEECFQECVQNYECVAFGFIDGNNVTSNRCFLISKLNINNFLGSNTTKIPVYSFKSSTENIEVLKNLEPSTIYSLIFYGKTPFGDVIQSKPFYGFVGGPYVKEIDDGKDKKLVYKVGDSIDLACQVKSNQLDFPQWMHSHNNNNKNETRNAPFNVTYATYGLELLRKSILHINSLTRHHNGTYVCITEIHTDNQIRVDVVVQDKPSGLKLTKLAEPKENLTYIEWSLDDYGDSQIICAEVFFERLTTGLNMKSISVVTYCNLTELNNQYMVLNFTIENFSIVKIRLNNSIGYSEYSNELLYNSTVSYKPVLVTNPIIHKKPNETSTDILESYKWVLNIIVLCLILIAIAIIAILLISMRKIRRMGYLTVRLVAQNNTENNDL